MVLEEDLSKFFDFANVKGLDKMSSLISDATKPDPHPVRLILDIPDKAAEANVFNVLSDANVLKRTAGDDIIIIVTADIPIPATIRPALEKALSGVRANQSAN
mmetsp:Transcript_23377/g.75068  ORF Transcript_23377/g.75068 Transcript_23377/m.75068 type:complete len:103 (-) Transcript_23377:86-394(-)